MSLLAENTKRWQSFVSKPGVIPAAKKAAARFVSPMAKARYQQISDKLKSKYNAHLPWWFIPLIHERECVGGNTNWTCNIAQGDPFNRVSTHVPKGRGPFASFEEAAVDALYNAAPYAAKNENWSGGGVMTIAEQYNGLGYAKKGRPSPYVWAGTDKYVSGKYIADGVYSASTVDTQLGVAVTLREMMKLDPTIVLDGDLPKQDVTPRKTEVAVVVTMGAAVTKTATAASAAGLSTAAIVGMVVAGLVIAGVILYFVMKAKKGSV